MSCASVARVGSQRGERHLLGPVAYSFADLTRPVRACTKVEDPSFPPGLEVTVHASSAFRPTDPAASSAPGVLFTLSVVNHGPVPVQVIRAVPAFELAISQAIFHSKDLSEKNLRSLHPVVVCSTKSIRSAKVCSNRVILWCRRARSSLPCRSGNRPTPPAWPPGRRAVGGGRRRSACGGVRR
jgi:hypothetical protein